MTTTQPVAIITGAGSGIGRAVANALSGLGYRLALVGRRQANLQETASLLGCEDSEVICIPSDIAMSEGRELMVEETIRAYGQIDVVVNNAGLGTCKVLGKLSEAEVEKLFAVNTLGPIDLVRRALPHLIESSGCVVTVASIAIVDPFVGLGVYGCSKAGVDGLARCIENEYGSKNTKAGLRAYTIAPGAVETEMLRGIVSTKDLPTEYTLTPEDVAEQIVQCVLNECSEKSGSTILMPNS